MRESQKILICLLLISLAPILTSAQIPLEAESEFEAAVDQYTVDYERLMTSRGRSSSSSAVDARRRRKVAPQDTQQEISEAFLVRGAPPLSEYVGSSSLADITRALRNNFAPGTALIFYAYRGDVFQVWLIDQSGLQAYNSQTLSGRELESTIYGLRSSLGVDSLQSARAPSLVGLTVAPKPAGSKIPMDRAIAEATALLLPAPIADRLNPVRHLIVAPILGIGTVPFAILRPFKSNLFLIDRMSVSIVPSLFDIETRIKEWTPRYQKPLVIGNPYLPPDSRWRVPPLPGAEDEAIAIAKLIAAKPLIGRRAVKRRVIARASEADFLYFATHGVASSRDPLAGGFLFLSARSLNQGFWTAKEVQGSKLRAQIAILSACQTGLGKTHDAGVIGLSRAFQIAGVPRVVMSLWSVNDKATAELMKSFVKNLRSNVPSEALRLAMLDVRRQRPAPSQWASFVLFGIPV
ncbi:MAG TPA: CHAT domain-containing protein [Pyrinomonadaceae bacterium]|jgi:CHAT domain-containing protein|nr:CHAT domain-containing protein [Pyrinomonadaceae bacterium]